MAPKENLTNTKTMDGNPPDGRTKGGDTNSFYVTESSTERKQTEGVKKGANWDIFEGVIGGNKRQDSQGIKRTKINTQKFGN